MQAPDTGVHLQGGVRGQVQRDCVQGVHGGIRHAPSGRCRQQTVLLRARGPLSQNQVHQPNFGHQPVSGTKQERLMNHVKITF